MLNHDDVVIVAEERADDLGGGQTLLDIKVGGGLVEHVDVGVLDADSTDGETLELTTRKVGNVAVQKMLKLKGLEDLFGIFERGAALDQVTHALVGAAHSLGDLVNVLRLDDRLEVILKQLGEVV